MNSRKKMNHHKRQLLVGGILAICLVGVMLTAFLANKVKGKESMETDKLSIPLSEVSGTASFYPVVIDGTQMEVLAVKASDGSVRTAFNTCQSCYTSGNGRYEAKGTELVCQNCGFHFSADEVGIETGGGCNPWPITDANREITENEIVISREFLEKSKGIFANWSKS